jgi:iron complex transport system permease protein
MSTLTAETAWIAGKPWRVSALLFLALIAALLASLLFGYRIYTPADLWLALTSFDGSEAHIVIRDHRWPRAIIAPICGAALGVAGVIMQTLARNRIASPDTLGVNAGASLAVVAASTLFGVSSIAALSMAAATGALLTSLLVFAIASTAGGLSPLRIVLIGVTIAGLFHALVEVVLTVREAELDQLLFWLSGAFVDRPLTLAAGGSLFVVLGLGLAFCLVRPLDVMQTDDATARTLGVPLAVIRAGCIVSISLLTGAAVAMAGPVAFVGLVVPHAARYLVGMRHSAQIPAAALCGALYATAADVVSRFVIYPHEAPVGAVTAVVGGVLLLILLRRRTA